MILQLFYLGAQPESPSDSVSDAYYIPIASEVLSEFLKSFPTAKRLPKEIGFFLRWLFRYVKPIFFQSSSFRQKYFRFNSAS